MRGFLPLAIASWMAFSVGFTAHGHGHASSQRMEAAPKLRYVVDFKGETPAKVRAAARAFDALGVDVAGVNYRQRTVEIIVTESEIAELQKKYRIRGTQVGDSSTAAIDPRYLNPERIVQRMKQLAEKFPKIAKLHEIGKSVEGRPILALELTSSEPTMKPSILFDGMHHAREIMTPEVVLDIAETLVDGLREGRGTRRFRESASLLSRARIWVVPQLNPDGNNIVWTSNAMWRKNAYQERGQIVGVDLNRNYGFKWGKCNGSSGSSSSDTYRGPNPISEPEIKAIVQLAERIRPIGYITYHSFGEMVLAPYGCQGEYTPEHPLLKQVGGQLAEALTSDSGRGHYAFGTSWEILYPTDGAAKDYIYSQFGAPSFTVEIGEAFQPDYSVREPTLKKQRIGWNLFANQLLQNLLVVRTKSAVGKPIPVRIEFAQVPHKHGERPFTSDEMGTFYKVLVRGNYTIRVIDSAGRGQEKSFTMDGQPLQLDFTF